MDSTYWIKQLKLIPHPEGGYYKETYRSEEENLFKGFDGKRNISTAIYFLLEGKDNSHFHRIKSDELWFFHEGTTLEIFCLSEKEFSIIKLGKDSANGEQLQALIPAGVWFGAKTKDKSGFALVSCTVAPGFDFKDFELATKEELQKSFPEHKELINEMTLN